MTPLSTTHELPMRPQGRHWLRLLVRRVFPPKAKKLRWNPMIAGYPISLNKKYFDHPSEMIGREFDRPDGRYRVTEWRGPDMNRDFLEDDGAMIATRISPNADLRQDAGSAASNAK